MVENPGYDPLDDKHRQARREGIERMADVETSRRHLPPRDLNRILLVLTVICGLVMVTSTPIAVWSVVRLSQQQKALDRQQDSTTTSRKATSDVLCGKLNDVVGAAQDQTDTLNDLILASVRGSRALEDTYTQLGFPDYAHRLADAKRQTAQLAAKKPRAIDCGRLSDAITAASK